MSSLPKVIVGKWQSQASNLGLAGFKARLLAVLLGSLDGSHILQGFCWAPHNDVAGGLGGLGCRISLGKEMSPIGHAELKEIHQKACCVHDDGGKGQASEC